MDLTFLWAIPVTVVIIAVNCIIIPSIALTSSSSDADRASAKAKLLSGEIKFIFVVDLYIFIMKV